MVLLRRRVALRMKLRCSCCGRWWCVEGNFQKRMSGEIKLEVVASAVTSQQSDALKKKKRANVADDSGIWFAAPPPDFQLIAQPGFIVHKLQCISRQDRSDIVFIATSKSTLHFSV